MTLLRAILTLMFATPSRPNSRGVGIVAGEGGWDLEDSNHRKGAEYESQG